MAAESTVEAPARDERRSRILAAARRLFSERGFSAVSTTEIAAEAGVARGLINHYFGTKRELYIEVVREMVRFRPRSRSPSTSTGPPRRLASSERIDRWLEMVSRNREAWLAAVGAEGLGRDPEIEAVLDEAREQATARHHRGARPRARRAARRPSSTRSCAPTAGWPRRPPASGSSATAGPASRSPPSSRRRCPRLVGEAYEAIPQTEQTTQGEPTR